MPQGPARAHPTGGPASGRGKTMSFTPMIAGNGLVGWQMLQATLETQRTAFDKSAEISRESAYFQEKIGSVGSAEELVADRRLLSVALSAFGMDDEIDSKYLIRRIIEEGTEADDALANRLNDSRYVALANAFDFEKVTTYKTQSEGFADPILAAYEERVRANLDATLAEPAYVNDPDYAALFKAQVEENLEISRTYFRETIPSITSAEDLLADPELMQVVLTAFDSQDRQGSTTLLRRVLEEGTSDPTALANVLRDDKLVALSDAFGFDEAETRTVLQTEAFASNIATQYRWQQFEDAVAEVDPAIGKALQFQRAIPDLSASDISDTAKWYNVLGSTMMRGVFETALNLPNGFSQIDIDKQVETLRDKVESRFGIRSFSDLEDETILNKVIHGYLLQEQISQSSGIGSQQIALTLLSTIRYPST
ncbi:DUF1217 domain-containing protein [Salipiger sp. P9]|uniref:DUF1217 domain-containing protein n=1 Tax=Salipiger pentaromativorans TaxID=2943193 RepID=UPI0021581D38|nr:DUF1217 domain-containing protein [Salipiger pentaromativorans]MCR8549502.1 DUF1217 domain-containing protein [Salipiger pentaromativorans]